MKFLRITREHHCKTALTWIPVGKRKVDKPKKTWRRSIEKERDKMGWKSEEEAKVLAKVTIRWKKSIKGQLTVKVNFTRQLPFKTLCETEREEVN